MTSLLENLDTDWLMTVLPQPKAPGMATVPPWTEGKRASSTRWPTRKGLSAECFSVVGRGTRTGHVCIMPNSVFLPSNSTSRILSTTV